MHAFRFVLFAAWAAMLALAASALQVQGMGAGEIFIADLKALCWRTQFNADFRAATLFLGAACVLAGGVFSMAYLFALTLMARRETAALLLASRKPQQTDSRSLEET